MNLSPSTRPVSASNLPMSPVVSKKCPGSPRDPPKLKRLRTDSVSSEGELKQEYNLTFFDVLEKGVQLNEDSMTLLSRMASKKAVTFDEITLADRPVDFHPNDVVLRSFITRHVSLKGGGILSAAMDTVTEREMALAMAKMGGMGVIHRFLSPDEQAAQVDWVRKKIHYGGMIDKPVTFRDTDYYSTFESQCKAHNWQFSSFPIVDGNNKFVGLVTKEVLVFVESSCNPQLKDVMLSIQQITVASSTINTEEAFQIMRKHKVKKLPVVDENGCLFGMYVWNDVSSDQQKRENYSLDTDGHFLVGAAIGVEAKEIDRAKKLVAAGCRVVVIDATAGNADGLKRQIINLRKEFGDKIDIIAGNIASYTSAIHLMAGEFKPDALKVGVGGGSTAITRDATGHGIPQVSALYEVWKAVRDSGAKDGYYVPIIADGGIRTSGDIVKCFAVGASGIMLGSLMAGTLESPGMIIEKSGRKYKTVRGMTSKKALDTQEEHNFQTKDKGHKELGEMKFGVEGRVIFTGDVEKMMTQLLGGIQSGLAHSGALTVTELQSKACIWSQSFAGAAEGKPHDIQDVRG